MVPRRWNVEVDGIRWLPRMIDKARMSMDGKLGAYLIGHSPVDRALLKRLRVTTDEFVQVVAECPNDMAVLLALRARGFDEASVRRWSERFEKHWALYIHLWDIDEGYMPARGFEIPLLALARKVEAPLMAMYRKIAPQP